MPDVEFEELKEQIEYMSLLELDTESLDARLLKNKYNLSQIKPIDYKPITKINADLWDLSHELDFWVNLSNFLKNCSYFNTNYTKSTISFIKKNCIEQLDFYINELETELNRLKVRI